MRKIIILLVIFTWFDSYSQDPSFSQSDLGSIYMNPAYTGASGHPKFLSIRREQWKNYNIPSNGEFNGELGGIRPFTTSLAEFSIGIDAGNDGRVGLRTIGIGASFMAEDHLLNPSLLANTIFLRRSDYQVYLSGLFKIGETRPLFGKGSSASVIHYAQPAISYGQSVYGLQTNGIVTSDMLDEYMIDYSSLNPLSINIQDLAISRKPFHKLVFGLLWSAQGNTNTSAYNRTESGFAFQRMTEGFNNNPLTSKITLHTKHKGSIPDWNFRMIPYWNAFAKREIYYSGGPFTNKIMGKTEIGGSIEVGRYSLLELGSLLRFTSDYRDEKLDVNWQTFSPFIRFNIRGRRHAFQLSWCSDIESTFFTNSENDLYIANTGITNEFTLTIILWGGKGPKECIEYGLMKKNGLLQDIKNNGLINKGGFK
jgi:hypothetical protein